ncbi:hypothetical protein [Fodinicola feengrottensis]|uniref:Uncharacterized protein n=1 Tax=Fodinicola feengrottensis TaxID=435914 RepID=A0ABN2IAA7_9ACTN|nr:hypothetical protein [Fodinicola feengrottensis]
MKRAVKEQWLRDLRSGDFKQGRSALRRADAYCCLGVLGDQLVRQGLAAWETCTMVNSGEPFVVLSTTDGFNDAILGDDAKETLGWPTSVYQDQLTALNDGTPTDASSSFPEIADWIDVYIPVDED